MIDGLIFVPLMLIVMSGVFAFRDFGEKRTTLVFAGFNLSLFCVSQFEMSSNAFSSLSMELSMSDGVDESGNWSESGEV